MKKILLPMILLASIDAVANISELPPAVRRTLARQLAEIVVVSGLSPFQPTRQVDVQAYLDGYRYQLEQAFATEAQTLLDYLEILVERHTARTDTDALASHVAKVMHTVAQDYAQQHDGMAFKPRDAHESLTDGFQALKDQERKPREGDNSLSQLYKRLSEYYKHDQERKELHALADDNFEYLQHYPQLDSKLTNLEFTHLLNYASNRQVSDIEISNEIDKVLTQLPNALFDVKHQELNIFDIIGISHFDEIIKDEELLLGERDLQDIKNNFANLSYQQEHIKGVPINFGTTLAQLLENRFLAGITVQFLVSMGWNWQDFSTMIYPDDKEQAALFVASYSNSMFEEETQQHMQSVLQKEKTKLSDPQKINAIDEFLAELPLLITKEKFIRTSVIANADGTLPLNEEKEKLMALVRDYHTKDMLRWEYLPTDLLTSHDMIIEYPIGLLYERGVSQQLLQRLAITPQAYDKLARGKILTEQDLYAVRMLINEENFKTITEITSDHSDLNKKSLNNFHSEMERSYYFIPLILQRDGFYKKIAKGEISHQNLLKTLAAVEQDSFYYPLAVKLLQELNGMSKRERKTTLSSIISNIKEIKKYQSFLQEIRGLADLATVDTQEHGIEEHPVELPDPKLILQQKKQMRKLQREAKRARQFAKTKVEQRANPEQQRQQAVREAEQKAERELTQRITKLSRMLGKTSLPADTPVWLHLRAILSYAGTDVQALVQRSDLKDMQARFFAIVAQDTTVMPNVDDLASISLALEKHIQKLKGLLPKQRSRIRDSVRAEMAALERIVRAGGQL